MADIVFVAILIAFFALCVGFVRVCERIIGPDELVSESQLADVDTGHEEVAA